jgi:hypothetical protein
MYAAAGQPGIGLTKLLDDPFRTMTFAFHLQASFL